MATILKEGSKGSLVSTLQKYLNQKGKPPEPVPENGVFDAATEKAVRAFQKAHGIKIDGDVGSETAGALAKLVGSGAASFAKSLGAEMEEEKEEKKPEETYNLVWKGKSYSLTKAEFDDMEKKIVAEIKRTAVRAAEVRVNAAEVLWETFNDLNNDQYVVSWFVNLTSSKFPDKGKIQAGRSAFQKLKSAVDSGECAKVMPALKEAQEPINKAYDLMMKYQEDIIGSAEGWQAGLEFTRDTSFDIVALIATAQLGGTPLAGAAAGGGSELVKSAAGEFGKYLAGTSGGGGAAAKNVIIDGLIGAGVGLASGLLKTKGDAIIKSVAERGAKKLAGTWVARVASNSIVKFLLKRLEGAGKAGLEAAVKTAIKALKGETTFDQFCEEVAKEMAFGALFKGLDDYIEGKQFAQTIFDKIPSGTRDKLFGKVKGAEAVKLLQDVVYDKGKDPVKKALEAAFNKAKGDESAQDLGELAAGEFAASGFKTIEAEITKAVKVKEDKDKKK